MNIGLFITMLTIFSITWCGLGNDILRTIWPYGTMSTGGIAAIWTIIYASGVGILCYAVTQAKLYYREFKLDYCRVIDQRFSYPDMLFPADGKGVFEIPVGTREFWLHLEDSDLGVARDTEVVYYVEPVLYLDHRRMAYASNDDVIHVYIESNGAVKVRYLDNHCTTGEIQWSMSEVKER